MSSFSFRNFVKFVDGPSDITDDQINEIFGIFSNNKKIDSLKKQREDLRNKQLSKEKDAVFAKTKAEIEGKPYADSTSKATTARSTHAADRAADSDWANSR